jgi:hypothetical protein
MKLEEELYRIVCETLMDLGIELSVRLQKLVPILDYKKRFIHT